MFFIISGRASPTETKSEKSSVTAMTGMSSGGGGAALAGKLTSDTSKNFKAPEAFFSLQVWDYNNFVLRPTQLNVCFLLQAQNSYSRSKNLFLLLFCFLFFLSKRGLGRQIWRNCVILLNKSKADLWHLQENQTSRGPGYDLFLKAVFLKTFLWYFR